MPFLDEASYRSTFGEKMQRVAADGNAPFPFWAYVDGIPKEDFQGYDCSEGNVRWIWRDADGRFEHILIDAKDDENVFMAVVLDLQKKQVAGHRLMRFKREYGLR